MEDNAIFKNELEKLLAETYELLKIFAAIIEKCE
jgi:hypothetical protein